MYCTILPAPPSTRLGGDESSAYHRFRRYARTLGTLGRSINALTLRATAAYFAALTRRDAETWTTLVTQTARLVDRVHALEGIIDFDEKDRAALKFFESIVRDNADLLVSAAIAAVTANLEPRRYAPAL